MKVSNKMGQLLKEFGEFLSALLTPQNLTLVLTLSGIFWNFGKRLIHRIDEKQNETITILEKRVDELEKSATEVHNDINKEILRLQILEGMESERLSESEMLYFFDKYKSLGGNSFVEEKAKEYLSKFDQRGGR